MTTMLHRGSIIREWLPAGLAVAAVLLTAVYAVTKESYAQEGIRRAKSLASALSNTAAATETTTLTPDQIADLTSRRTELEQRMKEAEQAACVVAQLTETARVGGLSIQEVQPFRSLGRTSGTPDTFLYPRYRIIVQGTYPQIAEYMDACKVQRVPARVVECRINRGADRESSGGGHLTAEIIVEAFQGRAAAPQQGKGTQ